MVRGCVTGLVSRAASRVPWLRRLPVLKLLVAAELAVLARDHVQRLTPEERARLMVLIRRRRGHAANLSEAERDELAALIVKMEPWLFLRMSVDKLSPWPLPQRLVRGRRRQETPSQGPSPSGSPSPSGGPWPSGGPSPSGGPASEGSGR